MGAFKQFLTQDIIVSPFEVNKGFSFTSSSFLDPDVGIVVLNGISGSFLTNKDTTSTGDYQEYKTLVFNSIKHLYYSNYSVSASGDPASLPIEIRGSQPEGDRIQGSRPFPNFENYLQSTLFFERDLPLTFGSKVDVLSIPSKLYGDQIQRGSLEIKNSVLTLTDDGEGNLLSGSTIVGNIFYAHGIVTLTNQGAVYGSGIYGTSTYGLIGGFLNNSITCSFSSSRTIYETQYKCTIRENEFNFSQNPSIASGSLSGSLYGFATSSYFEPYITTIGLYNENQDLLAVAKLPTPYPCPKSTDTTFIINLDR